MITVTIVLCSQLAASFHGLLLLRDCSLHFLYCLFTVFRSAFCCFMYRSFCIFYCFFGTVSWYCLMFFVLYCFLLSCLSWFLVFFLCRNVHVVGHEYTGYPRRTLMIFSLWNRARWRIEELYGRSQFYFLFTAPVSGDPWYHSSSLWYYNST